MFRCSRSVFALLLTLTLAVPTSATAQSTPDGERSVVVNGERLALDQIRALEAGYGVRVLDGDYWYDPVCGAWGFSGGPTMGFLMPGLPLGGALQSDASNGTTNVFINGRQLHVRDVASLRPLVGTVLPGRYWMDASGNVGVEGGPAFLNLVALARQRGGGNTFYRSDITGIGAGSSGGTSYVMGKDWSVIVD